MRTALLEQNLTTPYILGEYMGKMTGTPKSVFIAKVRELLQRCEFWRQWQWYQIHEARVRLREAELAITCFDDYDPQDLESCFMAASSAATVYAKCDDDLSILLQRRLIRSAHRWRIRVPSASDRTLWDKFPYRTNDRRLKPNSVHEIQETRIQRRVTAFGLFFGLLSAIQTVFAALTYFQRG